MKRIFPIVAVLIASAGLLVTNEGSCQQPDDSRDAPVGYPNWNLKTLGGLQFWTDVRNVGNWRIQRNSNTGHHRLIDPDNVRVAWGNLAHCRQKLGSTIETGDAVPHAGKVVILLHGLMRTSNAMSTMADFLEEHGFTVINFQYASSRETVEIHAADLAHVIDDLGPEVTEINFVGHSMGNLVVRQYLGNLERSGVKRDRRFHRMVMLGPPNQGSRMARILKNSLLFNTLAGASGAQLSIGWERLEPQLATPDFEFGIIAGGQDTEEDFSNFILRGRDDFTVSVSEAKLAGATDLLVQPLLHSTMMNQPDVLEATLRFLQDGCFVSPENRQPIPLSESAR